MVHVVQRCKGYGPSGSSFGFARLLVGFCSFRLQGENFGRSSQILRKSDDSCTWRKNDPDIFFAKQNIRDDKGPRRFRQPSPSPKRLECGCTVVWVFSKIGVPQNGWFMMENPIKMDDLGCHYFWKHPFAGCFVNCPFCQHDNLEPSGSNAGTCVCCWHGFRCLVFSGPLKLRNQQRWLFTFDGVCLVWLCLFSLLYVFIHIFFFDIHIGNEDLKLWSSAMPKFFRYVLVPGRRCTHVGHYQVTGRWALVLNDLSIGFQCEKHSWVSSIP